MAKSSSTHSPLQKKLIIGFWFIIGAMVIIVIVAVIADNKPEEVKATNVSHPVLAYA